MSRSPAADLAPLIKLLQAGVPPNRAATEISRVLAIWTAELKDDAEQLQERLSGLTEQMTTGIEEMHEGIAEASDKGKPTLRRILATHEAVLDELRKAQGASVGIHRPCPPERLTAALDPKQDLRSTRHHEHHRHSEPHVAQVQQGS
jgi:hypothetical protein